jgi:hypothetical protein
MTDPTAPETPRTEAGRALLEREAYNSRSFAIVRPEDILAIEREAGSTDALRMDDDHEPHPCCRHPRCCPHALAASDAGTATRSYIGRVRDTEERLIAESLRTDAGPAGSTDALRAALKIIDSINGCHGCLDNGNDEDRETVERLRAALAASDAGPAGRTDALPTIAALGDFIASKVIGNDNWTPHGLAADILDRLSRESDR